MFSLGNSFGRGRGLGRLGSLLFDMYFEDIEFFVFARRSRIRVGLWR